MTGAEPLVPPSGTPSGPEFSGAPPRAAGRPEPVPFLERVAAAPLIADGAMGTILYSLGISFERCFDLLNVTHPDLVRRVHNDYIAAGAELIETNTFGANAIRLAEHGLQDRVVELNRAGAALARQAAGSAEGRVWVAGSMGPLGMTLAPLGTLSPQRAREVFREQAAALAGAGVDLLIVETVSDLREALLALEAARGVTDLPVVVSMTFGEGNVIADGATPGQVAEALTSAGADVLGANCSSGPSQILDVVVQMAERTDRPVLAMPNAGLPMVLGGRYIYTSSPSYTAELAAQMVAAGVRIVGGCCGTTPEHIAAIREALRSEGSAMPRLRFPEREKIRASARVRMQRPTRLQDALARSWRASTGQAGTGQVPPGQVPAGQVGTGQAGATWNGPGQDGDPETLGSALENFVVSVEVDPPNGFDVGALLPKLRALRDSGVVDAFDVADSPRAQARMSALALAALIQGELGSETVLHMACRHRNLVAMHSEFLGAHALNVRNVFVVMGDPPALGDYPDATAVRDITATGLMALLAGFNHGQDMSGRSLEDPTAFHIGCAFNFNPPDLDRELRLLEKKVGAGAQFALTQPVYDPREVERVIEAAGGQLPVPVMLGVLPLWNARHAAFLHNEVPGIEVPRDVMRRMESAGEEGRDEGIAITQEILRSLVGVVQGAYFMPPFGRYEVVPDVMAGVLASTKSVPA